MIGDTRNLKGTIQPKLSAEALAEFLRGWKSRVGTSTAPVPLVPPPTMRTDGDTFDIKYRTWDDGSLKNILEIEVGKAGNLVEPGKPPRRVTYRS
jgi:hypothetical protein